MHVRVVASEQFSVGVKKGKLNWVLKDEFNRTKEAFPYLHSRDGMGVWWDYMNSEGVPRSMV